MSRFDVLHMIKRRAEVAGLPYSTCCHTFRATGITTYLQNGVSPLTVYTLFAAAANTPLGAGVASAATVSVGLTSR